MRSPCVCESEEKNKFMMYKLSQEISQWVNIRGTPCIWVSGYRGINGYEKSNQEPSKRGHLY